MQKDVPLPVHVNSVAARELAICFFNAITAKVLDKLVNDMVIWHKKNIVWLCVLLFISGGVGSCWYRAKKEKMRQNLICKIESTRESRRQFNAKIMRDAGIDAKIADGINGPSQSEISCFCDLAEVQHGINISLSDVAMFHEELNIKLLLTADRLYLCENGVVLYWELIQMEVDSIEWERKTYGDVFIGGRRYHFFVDRRKPFVDAMRKIIVNCKVHSEEKVLMDELEKLR